MIKPNAGQEFIINEAVKWYYHSPEQLFQYDGPPGSGKSFVLMEIVKRLGLDPLTEVAAMSFIGSASLVMRNKGLYSAKTAHSWLFNVETVVMRDENGKPIMDTLLNVPVKRPKFIPVDLLPDKIKLIIVDEGFSMPLHLRPEIEKFGIKILVCGDQNQLPPVGDAPAFLAYGKIYHLTEIMRQAGREDIKYIATMVQHGYHLNDGYYGNSLVIRKNDLTDDMLMWADAIICGKNNTRDQINQRIRAICGYNSMLPMYGEKVVCRNNNWLESVDLGNGMEINLVNGLIGRVNSSPDISSYDGEQFTMNFVPDLEPGIMFSNIRCNYQHMISNNKVRKLIRSNKYSIGNMFEYAYALTAHVAQGSQFHKVIYIEEPMRPELRNSINLVGATRADEALIYVKQF